VVLSFANISLIYFLEEGKEAFQKDHHEAIPEDDHDHAAGPCCSEMVAQTHDDHTF
jgi:hypothetical protein